MKAAFDFETYNWTAGEPINPLCCGWVLENGEDYWLKRKPDESGHQFLTRVLERMLTFKHVTQWWAHNAGAFDCLFLVGVAVDNGWPWKAILAGASRVIGVVITIGDRQLDFYDSFALVPAALDHRSKGKKTDSECAGSCCACGFELSRKAFQAEHYSGDMRELSDETLKAGCLVDCQLVLELLAKIGSHFETWGGSVRRTFASSALTIVKADLDRKGLALCNHFDAPDTNALAKRAYYGARNEVLHHMPSHPLRKYDINSSYPWGMAQTLPGKILEYSNDSKRVKQLYRRHNMLTVKAKVTVPQMHLPPLPYATESNIFFPTGTWEAWFPANELRYAATWGVKVVPLEAIAYETWQPFKEFVEKVYATKRNSTGALRTFCKYVLNSCYGKFGENPERERILAFATEDEAMTYFDKCIDESPSIMGDPRFLMVTHEKYSKYSHYGIASYITAYARMRIHQYMSQAKNVAYCDNDSLDCENWPGVPGKELGELKLELDNFTGKYYAPKMYQLTPVNGGKVKLASKGFPVGEKEFNNSIASATDETQKVTFTRVRQLKTQLNAGIDGTTLDARNVVLLGIVKRWKGLSQKRRPLQIGRASCRERV